MHRQNNKTTERDIKSRMNPDEKEDCECAAPPQAESTPARGYDRWATEHGEDRGLDPFSLYLA